MPYAINKYGRISHKVIIKHQTNYYKLTELYRDMSEKCISAKLSVFCDCVRVSMSWTSNAGN